MNRYFTTRADTVLTINTLKRLSAHSCCRKYHTADDSRHNSRFVKHELHRSLL